MSKQEEIRDGLAQAIFTYYGEFSDDVLAGVLLDYLHSQGVVIISESEKDNQQPTISWGKHKVAVEPLVKND